MRAFGGDGVYSAEIQIDLADGRAFFEAFDDLIGPMRMRLEIGGAASGRRYARGQRMKKPRGRRRKEASRVLWRLRQEGGFIRETGDGDFEVTL